MTPAGWTVSSAKNTALPIMLSYPPLRSASSSTLVVFIEGDGHAWHRKNIPSSDPTPRYPLGLRLAESTPEGFDIAYVARPCQFVKMPDACKQTVWTSHRYAEENVSSVGVAIDQLQTNPNQDILLVGYSGGGVIAALLAASREDISAFITVAANLDTDFWTSLHGVSPLTGSQNPSDLADRLMLIPQVHFVGIEDDVVPPAVLESYLQSIGPNSSSHLIVLEGYNHSCCWERNWPELFDTALTTLNLPRTE